MKKSKRVKKSKQVKKSKRVKKSKLKIKQRIIGLYLLKLLIYTVLYVALVFLFNLICTAASLPMPDDALAIIIAVFVVGFIILNVSELLRTGGYVETSYDAISNLTKAEKEKIKFPRIMNDVHLKVLEVENELLTKENAAREAEQKKNDLVVYLAHDLKTPLTSVIGYLSLLQEAPELPTEYRAKYIGITLDKAYRLEQLINELFDITRFNLNSVVLENNRVDLSMLLNQIAEEFYPSLMQKNLSLKTHIPPNIKLIGDGDKLARVFDNLIRNAVSYSYEGSPLIISADRNGKNAIVCVRNTGDEIPKEKLDMIFEKFFRADNARGTQNGGAGLGLAIAKEIVDLHGGTISAFSCRDYTEFTVTLPIQM